ncbi:MAG TPA: hypothetical protein DIW30_08085 [Bacteroidales bacterium]|nr:hypothetical protein [Bacteroidales bacterium]
MGTFCILLFSQPTTALLSSKKKTVDGFHVAGLNDPSTTPHRPLNERITKLDNGDISPPLEGLGEV